MVFVGVEPPPCFSLSSSHSTLACVLSPQKVPFLLAYILSYVLLILLKLFPSNRFLLQQPARGFMTYKPAHPLTYEYIHMHSVDSKNLFMRQSMLYLFYQL